MGIPMAGASYGVMSNTIKPLTNAQTIRGRPTPNDDNERAFRKGSSLLAETSFPCILYKEKRSLLAGKNGSFCELVGNI